MTRLRKILSSIALFTLVISQSHANLLIQDFENGLNAGTDGDGVRMGFTLFSGTGTTTLASNTILTGSALPDIPGKAGPNKVLQLDIETGSFAGIVNLFTNASADTWLSQDWSGQRSISFWLYGTSSQTDLFFDIINNRNVGSTTDDAERFVYNFKDNFTGWQMVNIPFTQFIRKEIGNGAPNDGLDLSDMRGWALGSAATQGQLTLFMDDVTAVPAPATLTLMVLGLAGLVLRRKRQQ
jgi:hypothetical protein